MKVNFFIIIYTAKEFIDGVMVDSILEIGKMIKWQEKGILPG